MIQAGVPKKPLKYGPYYLALPQLAIRSLARAADSADQTEMADGQVHSMEERISRLLRGLFIEQQGNSMMWLIIMLRLLVWQS